MSTASSSAAAAERYAHALQRFVEATYTACGDRANPACTHMLHNTLTSLLVASRRILEKARASEEAPRPAIEIAGRQGRGDPHP